MSEEYMRRAIELAKAGYDIVVNYVSNEAAAQAVVQEIGFLAAGGFAAASCMLRWSLAPCAQGA